MLTAISKLKYCPKVIRLNSPSTRQKAVTKYTQPMRKQTSKYIVPNSHTDFNSIKESSRKIHSATSKDKIS